MSRSQLLKEDETFPMHIARAYVGLVAAVVQLAACATQESNTPAPRTTLSKQAYPAPTSQPPMETETIASVDLKALPQTIGIEHQDRVNRFARLSTIYGTKPPAIDQMQVRTKDVPGLEYPVPVVRVLFDERVFFDFDKDDLRPDSHNVLDVVAENMKRDVPDAQLLILGHTDAIGSDAYNVALSRRRALSVMRGLIARGVRPTQLATVAIGRSQPIAPNESEEGRARNRRVEFMISASQIANLQLVHRRIIRADYMRIKPNEPSIVAPMASADVLVPTPNKSSRMSVNDVTLARTAKVELQKPTPAQKIQHLKPAEYRRMTLKEEFAL